MKRHHRLARTAIPLTALALVLTACGGSGSDDNPSVSAPAGGSGLVAGSVLRVNWGGFPESWAPGADMEGGYLRVPYENLTQLGAGNVVQPMLAASWEQTDEALTLTLQSGVTFHDGTPFNAEAVKTNVELVRDSPGAYSGPFQVVESIDVVDDLTVRLNLKTPAPTLLTTLSTRALPIGSPTAIKAGTIASAPVGTSPWAYDEAASVAGTRMTFKAYPEYWGEVPGYETVQLFAIQEDNAATAAMGNDEIDITDTELNQLETLEGGGAAIIRYPAIRLNPLFFDRGPGGMFEKVETRQAACYAIDTQVVADLEPDMQPSSQHFAEGEPGNNPAVTGYQHDLAKAKQLMEAAGNPTVTATMLAAPFNERQMQIYAEQMGEIGMDITVQGAPPPQYFSEWNSGKYAFGLGSNDELTPFDWYSAWFAADAPGNPSGAESATLKAAADAAIAAGDSAEANDLWAEVTKVIADEALTCAHTVGEEIVAVADTVTGAAAPSQPWEPMLINYRALRPAGA